jgi:hydrogenase maturation factor
MQLSEEKIKHILHKYKEMFEMLEHSDKTHEWSLGRARIDIILSKKTIKKLKEMKKKTKKPVSRIIEEAVENLK